jgi:hypothetical protein
MQMLLDGAGGSCRLNQEEEGEEDWTTDTPTNTRTCLSNRLKGTAQDVRNRPLHLGLGV